MPSELLQDFDNNTSDRGEALMVLGVALLATLAAWLHWRRFAVPITVAAGAGAAAFAVIALVLAAINPADNPAIFERLVLPLVLIAGLAVFGWAMRWDMSDPARETRRSDVAFWLHLLAAPMIAHPLFNWLGVTRGDNIGVAGALGVLAIYVLLGLVALAIDRRALLVSALAYVLIAMTWLLRNSGLVELNFAITALVIGSALLTLSAFWSTIRRAIVTRLPGGISAKLPPVVEVRGARSVAASNPLPA